MPVKTNVRDWVVQVICVATKGKEKEPVLAFVRGELAVHPSLRDSTEHAEQYAVTHIRTGLAVRSDLTKGEAFQMAEMVKILDWNFDSARTMPEQTRVAARGAWRAFGRGSIAA